MKKHLLALLLALTVSSVAGEPPSKPQRLVSICLQGDQLLLQLAPRERIAALSQFAADPDLSAHWEQARGIPVARDNAEGLVQLKPDLVLASIYTPPIVVAARPPCSIFRTGLFPAPIRLPTPFWKRPDSAILVPVSAPGWALRPRWKQS